MSEAIADSLFSWLDPAGNVNTLDVDVVMSTSDKRMARLSDHVVETGAVVTDHIVIQPEALSFELLVTQTPLGGPGSGMTAAPVSLEVASRSLEPATLPISVPPSRFQPGGFLLLSTGLRSVVASVFGGGGDATPSQAQGSRSTATTSTLKVNVLQATGGAPVDRVNDAHDTLIEIMNTGLLVTVSFKGRLYLDYLLTSVELSQGKGEAGCGRFKVEARAFRTVTGVNVNLPDPADFRALPKVSKGNTPAKDPDPDPTKKVRGKSAAKNIGRAANKLLGVP
jgi:hypothetical protein